MIKIQESYYGEPIGTHQRSFERYHTRPYGLHFPKIGDLQHHPKTAIAIISGTGEATNFKFGWYVHSVHLNKSPKKSGEKGAWCMQGLPNIFEYPLLSQE